MLIKSQFCSSSLATLSTVTVSGMELGGTIGGEERVGVDENCKIEEEEEVDERGEDGGII